MAKRERKISKFMWQQKHYPASHQTSNRLHRGRFPKKIQAPMICWKMLYLISLSRCGNLETEKRKIVCSEKLGQKMRRLKLEQNEHLTCRWLQLTNKLFALFVTKKRISFIMYVLLAQKKQVPKLFEINSMFMMCVHTWPDQEKNSVTKRLFKIAVIFCLNCINKSNFLLFEIESLHRKLVNFSCKFKFKALMS